MKYCSACKEKFDDTLSFCPRDGEVLEEDPSSLIGSVLDGQYQIEGVLGKGGMGAVYKARHILLGDRVAIKVLPPEMRSNSEWLRRFQREGQAARRFRHPNAVTVYDLRTSADGTIYLVMECVDGNTLDAELKNRGKFSPAEAVAVLDPIMSVLNAAHAMGVVHRDLKPENIMIGKPTTGGEPVVKLLDLGIAKLREVAGAEKTGSTNLTIAGQMLGTPYYMSPEQWGELPDDGNSEIDGRADIYSLGIVFYELIAGQRPFAGLTLSELRRQHVSLIPPTLHETDASVSQAFSAAIARSMAKDRSERQNTANELKDELVSALAAEGIAPPVSITSELGKIAGSSQGAADSRSNSKLTAAERTAPTVVAGSIPTGVENAEPGLSSQAGTMPTVVAAPRENVQATFVAPHVPASPHTGTGAVAGTVTPPSRRSPLIFVGVAVVALLLIVAGGGYAVFHFMSGKSESGSTANNSSTNTGGNEASVGAHEIARYWLQVNKSSTASAGDPIPMQSGQEFKFHFSPNENGYLYVIGPGENNAPMTFLTAKPAASLGIKTNEVKSGIDFSFPADLGKNESWLSLDKTPGVDEYTIVFSTTQLAEPAFLSGPALLPLTQEDQQQLESLSGRLKANLLGVEVVKTGASPFVSVKTPQNAPDGASVVFKVRIEHK
jgi:eukaryotic-like serine/threonine-protein kinase